MNLPDAYVRGFKIAFRLPRLAFLAYTIFIALALLIVLPFHGSLTNGFGQSGEIRKLLTSIDISVLFQFFKNNDILLSYFSHQLLWILGISWILGIFINGGIIRVLTKQRFTVSNFFTGAATNFFRFLGLGIFTTILHIVFILCAFAAMVLVFETEFTNEIELYNRIFIVLGVYFAFFVLIQSISDYAKFIMALYQSNNCFKRFFQAMRFVFKHFLKTYFLYLMLVFVPFIALYFYITFQRDIGLSSMTAIIAIFFIQQIYFWLRIWFRVWIFASQLELYTVEYIHDEKVRSEKERRIEWDRKAKQMEKEIEEKKQ